MPGRAVGAPAAYPLVAAYLVAALTAWVAAAAALVVAADDLAAGRTWAGDVVLAVHLAGLGFLPLAVAGAVQHVLPLLLRVSVPSPWPARLALPLLLAGPVLAAGVAADEPALVWPASGALAAGLALVLFDVGALVARAPRGRQLVASRVGVALSGVHAAAAGALGAVAFGASRSPRLVLVHLHLATIGWLALLIVAVGRTLGPMLALSAAPPARRLPAEELGLAAGLWLLVAGLAWDLDALSVLGAAAILLALGRFVALIAAIRPSPRAEGVEGPLAHFLAGGAFLVQAAALGGWLVLADEAPPRRVAAYVVLLLLGFAAGVTVGHAGKLLTLSRWAAWPPGPRPKQAALYSRRAWVAEAALFAAGVEAVAAGTLAGSSPAVRAGAVAVAASATLALALGLRDMTRMREDRGRRD